MPIKPTPTATLANRGSWRAKTRPDEPMPEIPRDITPPADLTGKALHVWDALAPRLHGAGTLTSADVLTFARYCRLYVVWDAAMTEVEENPTNRAAVLTLAKLDEMTRKLEASFGLNPADRTGIKVDRPAAEGVERFFAA